MEKALAGKSVAVLVANGFAEVNMTEPQRSVLAAGAKVRLVSPENGVVNGWHEAAWGHYFPVDQPISSALAADFDALMVPGGPQGIGKLAQSPHTVRFLRGFLDAGKPVVLFGEAVTLLATADRAKGQQVAAPADGAALVEAGAVLADEPVVVSGMLVTVSNAAEAEQTKEAIAQHLAAPLQGVAEAA